MYSARGNQRKYNMYRTQVIKKWLMQSRFHMRTVSTGKQAKKLTIKDIPQPISLPLIGTKFALYAAGGGRKLHEYIDRRHEQLGPIFCEKLSSADIIFLSDPALMKSLFLNLEGKYPTHILPDPWILYEKLYGSKRGLFFMDGEEWLVNRRIMNKHLLHEGAEKWLNEPVKLTISKFVNTLKTKVQSGDVTPSLESELYKLSTNAIISVLLGPDSSFQESEYFDEMLDTFSETVKKVFETTSKLFILPANWYQQLNMKAWKDFKESVDSSLYLAQKLVQEMLNNKKDFSNGLIQKLSDDKVSDETIIRLVADFVIAAGDTTAYTTLWTLYLLSKNQEVVNELRSRGDIYAKHILKEAMRMYPVAPFLTRILPKESVLGPYKLDAGTPIVASIYTSGRDEQYFSKANMFLPYRWDKSDEQRKSLANHEPSASLPFAIGARSCIGKKIAMVQLTEIITQVVNNFDIKCSPENLKVDAITSMVLVPEKPIKLEFKLKN